MTRAGFSLAAGLLCACAAGSCAPPAVSPSAGAPVQSAVRDAITQHEFVPIGGIEQWVTIDGDSRANPVVLFLHGGPGNPLTPYAAALYGGWTGEFTIAQWDQRGAGRTFGRNPAQADQQLSFAQMAGDGIEVTEYLARTLGKRKIFLVGGSWGSALGARMAAARPDLFHAFVGVGQLVSYRDNQAASFAAVLQRARAAGDFKTITALEALGPPPWTDPRAFGILRRATRVYEAKATVAAPKGWWVPAEPYASAEALAEHEAGEDYSYLQFVGLRGIGMFSTIELPAGQRFAVPVHIVQGAEDLVTTPDVARAYFESLSAPRKAFVLLERTGHDPNQRTVDAVREVLRGEASRLNE